MPAAGQVLGPHHGDEFVHGVDPEVRPQVARPAEDADRARPRAAGRVHLHRHAETESVAPLGQRPVGHRRELGRERVPRHQRDRLRPQDPGLAEDPAVQQHLREAEIVVRRREQPSTPPEEPGVRLEHLHEAVAAVDHQRALRGRRVHGRQAVAHVPTDPEPRVAHAERTEDLLIQETVERLTRRDLDHAPRHVETGAVAPLRAGREEQRNAGDAVGELRQRPACVVQPRPREDGVHGTRREAVGQARRVVQKLPHGHRRLGGPQDRVVRRATGEDPHVGERRDVPRHRIVKVDTARVDEAEESRRDHRLRHGEDPEDGIAPQRLVGRHVRPPEGPFVPDAALPDDDGVNAAHASGVNERLQRAVEPVERRGREAQPFR